MNSENLRAPFEKLSFKQIVLAVQGFSCYEKHMKLN